MYSGISGLKNLQTKLDVIGNNVANVNTYGFKKSRVTFSDAMNQTVSGASAATANKGGTNSKQIGLGSTIATIDTIHTQSSLQTTGRDLDLGISGDGYFVVKQGDSLSYTRAGNFYLDDNGTLVNANGLKVQAYKIDENGKRSKTIGDVAVNVNAILPAITTTKISVSGNLASDAIGGTVFSGNYLFPKKR
jgi:flagellar hook protein FlgE